MPLVRTCLSRLRRCFRSVSTRVTMNADEPVVRFVLDVVDPLKESSRVPVCIPVLQLQDSDTSVSYSWRESVEALVILLFGVYVCARGVFWRRALCTICVYRRVCACTSQLRALSLYVVLLACMREWVVSMISFYSIPTLLH